MHGADRDRLQCMSGTEGRPEVGGNSHGRTIEVATVIIICCLPLALTASIVLINMSYVAGRWILWLVLSLGLTIARLIYAVYVVIQVVLDILLLSVMKTCHTVYRSLPWVPGRRASTMRYKLMHTKTYKEYLELADVIDEEEGHKAWRDDDSDFPQGESLLILIDRLEGCLRDRDVQRLMFTLLSGLLKRNHLGIDERALHLKALAGTKRISQQYIKKVIECLNFMYDCPELSREDKLKFFSRARKSLGRTALMLSGGGAIAMYHVGVLRALIEQGLFKYITVISGTSGGSIITGLLAFKTEKELLEKCLIKEVSHDYGGNGEMKRRGIRWFPPLLHQVRHFLKNGVLIDNNEFAETCKYYYGDWTFQEAFARTGRHVCISVSASTLGCKFEGGPRRLLLNHITSPHVLIRSAVAASCSLPGIMNPNPLLCKDSEGNVSSFELDGVHYVDGSLQADLPFRRISTMFSVSHFIVSQVNFHVLPFLHKSHHPNEKSLYWRLFRFLDADIRHRALSLAELGLLPRVFGQDFSGVFKQRYFGHVTIVPKLRMSEMVGLSAFTNPTEQEMEHYIVDGQRNAWTCMEHIRHNTAIERAISDCLKKLRKQVVHDNGSVSSSAILAATKKASSSGSSTTLNELAMACVTSGVTEGSMKLPVAEVVLEAEVSEEEEEEEEEQREEDGPQRTDPPGLLSENKALRREVQKLRALVVQLEKSVQAAARIEAGVLPEEGAAEITRDSPLFENGHNSEEITRSTPAVEMGPVSR